MSSEDEDFARFLESFSPDKEEAGRLYIRLEKKLVGFFGMKGISDSTGAADETLRRAAQRLTGGADVPSMENYCLGIARNVANEWWRRERREEVVFRRFVQSLADNSAEEVDRIEHVLKPCFEGLKSKDRELLQDYCAAPEGLSRAEHRRSLAEKLGLTLRALRIQVSRLRDRLEECVEGLLRDR
jgi:DNA-directed RNA polymerase specialized sigma24 family protein